jgi:hypothetical protein
MGTMGTKLINRDVFFVIFVIFVFFVIS